MDLFFLCIFFFPHTFATFCSADCGGVIYMYESTHCLSSLDAVNHGALRFTTNLIAVFYTLLLDGVRRQPADRNNDIFLFINLFLVCSWFISRTTSAEILQPDLAFSPTIYFYCLYLRCEPNWGEKKSFKNATPYAWNNLKKK